MAKALFQTISLYYFCMLKAIPVALLALALAPRNETKGACPILLVSGEKDHDTISVTFRNVSKFPIRRLEFDCRLANVRTKPADRAHCVEPNASFLPFNGYTVSYGIPNGSRGTVLVSVKEVMLVDGRIWKPTKKDPCRVLTIRSPAQKK